MHIRIIPPNASALTAPLPAPSSGLGVEPQRWHGRAAKGHVLVPIHREEGRGLLSALETAAALRPGAQVTLLHVLPAVPQPGARSFHWLDAIDNLHRADLRADLAAVERVRNEIAARVAAEVPAKLRGAAPLRVECRVGEPAAEIARFAQEKAVDLVVLSRERGGWRWPLRPRLTDRIAGLVETPVVLVRAPSNAPNGTAAPSER